MQLVMLRENEREFSSKLLQLYGLWATVPSDSAKQFAEDAMNQLDVIRKSYYPYIKVADRATRDKNELKIVEKIFNQFGLEEMVPGHKEPPKRESFWEKKLKESANDSKEQ